MLVNNAGMGLYAPILASDLDAMQKMIALNVTALMRLSHAAAMSFVERRDGILINISSVVAAGARGTQWRVLRHQAFVLA